MRNKDKCIQKALNQGSCRSASKIAQLLLLFALLSLQLSAQSSYQKAPKRDTLNLESRIYGLSQVWYQIKTDFAYYDKLAFDWDSTYKTSLHETVNTSDRFEYYQILRRLVARLRDGHTNVYLPADLREKYLSVPPIRLKQIQGRPFIQSLLNDTLAATGLSERDEVLKINDMEVSEYGKRYVMPYVSASTPQDLLNRTYSNELLAGPKDEVLTLMVRKANGTIRQVAVSRALVPQKKPFESITFRLLPENTGLLTVNTFDDISFPEKIAAIIPRVVSCKALIIDLRRNGGGNGQWACDLLDYLFKDHYFDTRAHSRIHVSAWEVFHYPKPDSWIHQQVDSLKYKVPKKSLKFLRPIAVLTSEKTFSAAEDFTAVIKQNHRGVIIGTSSAGSTGMNVYHQLPGGGNFRLTIKKDTYMDDSDFVGVGIRPDIEVEETADDFLGDKDEVLRTAINYLKGR